MANSSKKPQSKLIEIDLTNIVTEPDLEGTRTRLDGINKVIGNLFFNRGSVPVHDKGKELYYNGKVTVTKEVLMEMNALVNTNPVTSIHFQNAISEYFKVKLNNNG